MYTDNFLKIQAILFVRKHIIMPKDINSIMKYNSQNHLRIQFWVFVFGDSKSTNEPTYPTRSNSEKSFVIAIDVDKKQDNPIVECEWRHAGGDAARPPGAGPLLDRSKRLAGYRPTASHLPHNAHPNFDLTLNQTILSIL